MCDKKIKYNTRPSDTLQFDTTQYKYDISCKMHFVGVQCTMYNVRCGEYLCFLYICMCMCMCICMCGVVQAKAEPGRCGPNTAG